jgi:hypothetical protein
MKRRIEPGDRVVCINDRPFRHENVYGLTKGEVYTVASVICSGAGLVLKELDPFPLKGFYAHRFERVTSC